MNVSRLGLYRFQPYNNAEIMNSNRILVAIFCLFIVVSASLAQQPTRVLTADNYARAEKMLSYNTEQLVDRNGVRATWLPDGRFWYRVMTPTGTEYVVVNPADGSRKAAASLSDLGLTGSGSGTARAGRRRGGDGDPATSPDGTRTAFIRDYNLWVRDNASAKETQLTKDGIKAFGYATNNAGWTHGPKPSLAWSPDGKKNATFQQGERNVSDVYLVPV